MGNTTEKTQYEKYIDDFRTGKPTPLKNRIVIDNLVLVLLNGLLKEVDTISELVKKLDKQLKNK